MYGLEYIFRFISFVTEWKSLPYISVKRYSKKSDRNKILILTPVSDACSMAGSLTASKLFLLVMLLFSISSIDVSAQGEANFWYFGFNAGLDFNGGAPVAVNNGQVSTSEGSASISDAGGNLLFYTDGITVYNKNHVQMPNGNTLLGNPSSTQSAVIIQKPGSSTIYYIITADIIGGAGIAYSIVDMTLNAGLGNVTTKNTVLYNQSSERITGVRHCNNKDVWIVTHDYGTNTFRTFLLTSAGISALPVLSNVGLAANGGFGIGYMKASPDGQKLAVATWDASINRFEAFDFNNSTGVVSNTILFPQIPASSGAYGLEFSPDGTKLYGALITPASVYQFNLCAGSAALVQNSAVLVGTGSAGFNGALQLGPDKKIYLAQYGVTFLGVINNPNALGTACNYVDNGVSIGTKTNGLGLPNFVPFYLKQPPAPFTTSINCLDVDFVAPPPAVTSSNCSGATIVTTTMLWDFDDPASGASNASTISNPSHSFTGSGTYNVKLILTYPCGSDTLKQNVTVVSCGGVLAANITAIPVCPGGCSATKLLPTGGKSPYTYLWDDGSVTQNIKPCPLVNTTYSVTITDATGLTATATVAVNIVPGVVSSIAAVNIDCKGNANGTATATGNGGTSPFVYNWSNTQTTQKITGLAAGNYNVTITDKNSCSSVSTVTIVEPTAIKNNVSTTAIKCAGGTGTATATASGGTGTLTYVWSTSATGQTAGALPKGNYSVTVLDSNNCKVVTPVVLTQPPAFTAPTFKVTPVSCGLSDGIAIASASGGTGALTYLWSNNVVGATATNLALGSYNVTITDANGCTITATTNLTNANGPTITKASGPAILCNGGLGVASVNITGGKPNYTYSWSNNVVATTGALSNAISSLVAGTYFVTITDAGTCAAITSVTITQPSALTIRAASTNAICLTANGGATVSVNGGSPSYTYNWSPVSKGGAVLDSLRAGIYALTVTDANGCTVDTSVVVAKIDLSSVNITAAKHIIVEGSSVALSVDGGISYSWTPVATLSCNTCANPIATPSVTTTYTIVASDINGCTITSELTIIVKPPCMDETDLFVPNVFSPNNDGINDILYLEGNGLTNIYLAIYDRWGNLIFESFDQAQGWDGMNKGNKMENGVYVYYLKAICIRSATEVRLKGNVSLIR